MSKEKCPHCEGSGIDGSRRQNATVKVPRESTGLNAALYVHCDRTASGAVSSVHISYPGQIGETQIERVVLAFNDAIRKALIGAE